MQVAFTDPMKVSASAEFRVTPSNTNSSNTSASLTYVNPATAAVAAGPSPLQSVLTNNNNPSAGRAVTIDSSRPAMAIGTIQNGLQDVSVFLDNPQPGQELQVMTRDGRQILGSAIDPTSSLGTALMSTPGVATGAQFSANYLNKSGSAGYKDMTVFYGARAGVLQKPVYDSSGHAVSTQAIAANLTSTPINPLSPGFAAGSFVLNGVSLGALTPTGGSLSALSLIHI